MRSFHMFLLELGFEVDMLESNTIIIWTPKVCKSNLVIFLNWKLIFE